MQVDVANNGIDATFMGESEPYDIAVLDLGLPGRPGLEVLRHWRESGNPLPVLILTARDAWHEKVDGFKAGADDYLGKPFHSPELIARLQALLRRGVARPHGPLRVAGLALDEDTQTVGILATGETFDLTGLNFACCATSCCIQARCCPSPGWPSISMISTPSATATCWRSTSTGCAASWAAI